MSEKNGDKDEPRSPEKNTEEQAYADFLKMLSNPGGDWREGHPDSTAIHPKSYRRTYHTHKGYEHEPPEVIEAITRRRQEIEAATRSKRLEAEQRAKEELDRQKRTDFANIQSRLEGIVKSSRFPHVIGSELKVALSTIIPSTEQYRWESGSRTWSNAENREHWDKDFAEMPYLPADSKIIWKVIRSLKHDDAYLSAEELFSLDSYNWLRTQNGTLGASLLLLYRYQRQSGEIIDWTSWRNRIASDYADEMVKDCLDYLRERVLRRESEPKSALRSFMLGRYWDYLRSEFIASILNEVESGWLRHPFLELSYGITGAFQSPLRLVTSINRRGKYPVLKYQNDVGLSIHALFQNSLGMPIHQWVNSVVQAGNSLPSASGKKLVSQVVGQIQFLNTEDPI